MLVLKPSPVSIPVIMGSGPSRHEAKERLLAAVPKGGRLFAVVDPCVFAGIDTLAGQRFWETAIVAPGSSPGELLPVLPRVVSMTGDDFLLTQLVEKFGEGAGFFVSCEASLDISALTAHLSSLCHAANPEGKPVWFRFYDPYVMHLLLKRSPPSLYCDIFGSRILQFIVEDVIGSEYKVWTRAQNCEAHKKKRPPCLHMTPTFQDALNEGHYELFLHAVYTYYFDTARPGLGAMQKEEAKLTIRHHIAEAEKLGFQAMGQIFRFLQLAFKHGWSFHSGGPFAEILQKSFPSVNKKLDALESVPVLLEKISFEVGCF